MADARRQFSLPEEDQAFVEGLGLPWETFTDSGTMWLVLHEYPIVGGFNVDLVSVAFLLPGNYPTAQIDMAYFCPHLARADGQPIGRLTNQQIDGKLWQRWSRHRGSGSAWRPGIDGVQTHLVFMDQWLEREVHGGAG